MSKVSIVMPTYGQAAHIGDALKGVASQTFGDFELIVVLDGPDQDTGAVLDGAMRSGQGFRLVSLTENMGTAEALNYGFAKASGDYWTWISSDNVMHHDWLSTLVGCLDIHRSVDAVFSGYVRESGKMTAKGWMPMSREVVHSRLGHLIESENCFIGPSFLYRRELHDRVGTHRGAISHDYDWWLRAEECGEISAHTDILCCYRVHCERVTITRKDQYDAHHWRAEAMKRRGIK